LKGAFYDLNPYILAGFSNYRLAALLGVKSVCPSTDYESSAGRLRSGDRLGAGVFIVAAFACGDTLTL
jgi:hypothetical protein